MIGTLQQAYNDMKSGTYNFTDNGNCSSCGQCCSNFLPLSAKEIKKIHWYIRKHKIKECKHLFPTVATFDLMCPFRSEEERKCVIYECRPEICRRFKCDNTDIDIKRDRELMIKKYNIVDVRETFFGGEA